MLLFPLKRLFLSRFQESHKVAFDSSYTTVIATGFGLMPLRLLLCMFDSYLSSRSLLLHRIVATESTCFLFWYTFTCNIYICSIHPTWQATTCHSNVETFFPKYNTQDSLGFSLMLLAAACWFFSLFSSPSFSTCSLFVFCYFENVRLLHFLSKRSRINIHFFAFPRSFFDIQQIYLSHNLLSFYVWRKSLKQIEISSHVFWSVTTINVFILECSSGIFRRWFESSGEIFWEATNINRSRNLQSFSTTIPGQSSFREVSFVLYCSLIWLSD